MSEKKIISFRFWGDYALYKKPWCNREQQSFLIPTKTAIIGMIGGILGFSKEEYLERLPSEKIKVGIKLNKEIGKELHGFNFMQSENLKKQTKKLSNPYRRKAIEQPNSRNRLEMLKNPDYKLFIQIEDTSIYNRLKNHLEESKYVFPPFMGQVNLFGNISEAKELEFKEKDVDYVNTVVPSKLVDGSSLDGTIFSEQIPFSMKEDRSEPEFISVSLKNKKEFKIAVKTDKRFKVGKTSDGTKVALF